MRRIDRRRSRRPAPLRPASSTDDVLLLVLSLDFAANRAPVMFVWGESVEHVPLDDDLRAEPVGRALLDAIADYLTETGRMPRPPDATSPPDAAGPTAPDEPADG